jgi:cardiolipin synthase
MTAEIEAATTWVHVEFYITAWDEVTGPFYEALVRAVERGVTVRLLFDHLGSRGIPGTRSSRPRWTPTGIEWHPMLPIQPLKGEWRRPDLRNHRKILVVDGAVAFTGSQNLIEPGYNKPKNHELGREWVELVARVEGPGRERAQPPLRHRLVQRDRGQADRGDRHGVAAGRRDRGQVIPSGPGFATENNLRAFTTLLYSAQSRLSITSPYFVPDESLLYAITTAAQRGVDVELFVSEAGDQFMVYHAQRSYYEALLRAGVRIYMYPHPRSCTRSSSASTTMSRCWARATWTCAPSA